MDFNRLTIKSQEAVAAAVEDARRRGNPEVYPEHLLLALLDQELPRSLVPVGAVAALRGRGTIGAEAGRRRRRAAAAHVDRALERPRQGGLRGAQKLDDEYVSVEHLPARARHVASRRAARAHQGRARRAARHLVGPWRAPTRRWRSSARPDGARRGGKLDPIIGRDEEIRRVIQVLSRRTKNNPVLIGDPGVGKTAIVEGLRSASSPATSRRA